MSAFLYFASGITNPIDDKLIKSLELGYAFPQAPVFGVLESRTPSGAPGTIMVDRETMRDVDPVYSPDKQTWRKRPGDDCVWVGYWNDEPPTPRDLANENQIAGENVELGGSQWIVPSFVWHSGEDGFRLHLPTYFDLDENGKWVYGEVEQEYAHLNKIADRIHQGVYLDDSEVLTTKEMLGYAPVILAVNYRVSELECAMLRLFKRRGNCLRRIAEVCVDYENAMEWLQKKTEV